MPLWKWELRRAGFIWKESLRIQGENLEFSMKIIRENGLSESVALVTDEYHQFRAGRIAASLGVESAAVCAHTPWYIFSACWARELLALSKFLLLG